jgi:hypothetical protein
MNPGGRLSRRGHKGRFSAARRPTSATYLGDLCESAGGSYLSFWQPSVEARSPTPAPRPAFYFPRITLFAAPMFS